MKSIRGYDQPVMIDYTLQLKDKFTSHDLNLSKEPKQKEYKQEQIKTMQEAVKKASQNLKSKDKSKDLDR